MPPRPLVRLAARCALVACLVALGAGASGQSTGVSDAAVDTPTRWLEAFRADVAWQYIPEPAAKIDPQFRLRLEEAGRREQAVVEAAMQRWISARMASEVEPRVTGPQRFAMLAYALNLRALAAARLGETERDAFFLLSRDALSVNCDSMPTLVVGPVPWFGFAGASEYERRQQARYLALRQAFIEALDSVQRPALRVLPDWGSRVDTALAAALTAALATAPGQPVSPILKRLPNSVLQEVIRLSQAPDGSPPVSPEAACGSIRWHFDTLVESPPAARSADVHAWLYATIDVATSALEAFVPPGLAAEVSIEVPVDYPPVAAAFRIEGRTRVRVKVDSSFKPQEIEVVQRVVRVPGLGEQMPLAFERAFDQASIKIAEGRDYRGLIKPRGRPPTWPAIGEFDIEWKLK